MSTVATLDELDTLVGEGDLAGDHLGLAQRLHDASASLPVGHPLRAEVLVAASEQYALAEESTPAIDCAREAVADGGHVRRSALAQLAAALHAAGKHGEARAALADLRRARPTELTTHLFVGVLSEQYDDQNEALCWYTRGLALAERGEQSEEDSFVAGLLLVRRAQLRWEMGLPADDWDEVGQRIAIRMHDTLSRTIPEPRRATRGSCACGSGRKDKRCCGSDGTSGPEILRVASDRGVTAVTSRVGDTVVIDLLNA